MVAAVSIKCLLWDFGDTLCDERSLWRESPEWMEVYRSFDVEGGIGAAWNQGLIDSDEFAAKLAERMTLTEAEIRRHLARTDLIAFFPYTHDFFRARHLPQAVVTVNPSAFREMAHELGLAEVTDAIVVSGEEKTTDKGELCEIALSRMRIGCTHEQALLIDNNQANLDAWEARGGSGYLYTTDAVFQRDVADGIDGLTERNP